MVSWISISDAIDRGAAATGTIYISRIALTDALKSGKIKSKAMLVRTGYGMMPKETKFDEIIPAWFWILAKIDWDDLSKPAIHRSVTVQAKEPFRLPYFEAHQILLDADEIDEIWPEIDQSSANIDKSTKSPRAPLSVPHRRRGPAAETRKRVVAEMKLIPASELELMKEEAMASTFRASRDTCRKAREEVLSEIASD